MQDSWDEDVNLARIFQVYDRVRFNRRYSYSRGCRQRQAKIDVVGQNFESGLELKAHCMAAAHNHIPDCRYYRIENPLEFAAGSAICFIGWFAVEYLYVI